MSDSLGVYLHDHLAGSNFAIDLLKTLRDQHAGEPLGAFAAALLVAVEEDRQVLQGIIDRVGAGPPMLKEAAAWMGEKLSQLKLRRDTAGALGSFEALETLGLGILGKLAMWRALQVIVELDVRVSGVDYDSLAKRAQDQHAQVEERRLQQARNTFGAAAL